MCKVYPQHTQYIWQQFEILYYCMAIVIHMLMLVLYRKMRLWMYRLYLNKNAKDCLERYYLDKNETL